MVIVVTGAYGFIGSNIVKALNQLGYTDIIAVDNLKNGTKFTNLVDCELLDYVDKEDFIRAIVDGDYDNQVDYIFHQGACSDTTHPDGKYMMHNNYEYSCLLLEYAQKNQIPLLYASSAATYGSKTEFIEELAYEEPLNVYGYSKFLFDQVVRRYYASGLSAPVVGLRYFNVYGDREAHKERMASVVYHNFKQLQANGKVNLFEGCQGYANGEQMRDFISIYDVVKVNLFFFNNHVNDVEEISGIFNCGTGRARSFNDLAVSTINAYRKLTSKLEPLSLKDACAQGLIEYIPFPNDLAGRYQCYTQANLDNLHACGYNQEFLSLESGVEKYVEYLLK